MVNQALAADRDEITVTARKREENLQSVPISISAFTAEDLKVRDIVDLKTLANQTPGLSFATTGAVTNTRAIIRGMSQQTRVGDETNVATFIDGVYTPGFSGAEFFGSGGLERIEVLKGPQSALYGRNSFAGAINYVTAQPTLDYEYGGDLTLGSGERQGATAYVSGPIFSEQVAMRFDAGHNRSGGSFTNEINDKPLGSADTTYVRFGTIWDGSERSTYKLSLSWQKDDDSTPVPVTLVADDDPRRIGRKITASPFEAFAAFGNGGRVGRIFDGKIADTSEQYFVDPRAKSGDRMIYRGALTFEYDFDNFQLVTLSSYQRRQIDVLNDFNSCRRDIRSAACNLVSPTAVGTFFGGALDQGVVIGSVLTGNTEDRSEISQDVRLQSTGDGQWQWSTGIYYSSESFRDNRQRLSDVDLTGGGGTTIYAVASPVPLIDSSTLFTNDFYSIYGSLSYDLSDAWNFVAEARYTHEDKTADEQQNNFPSTTPPTGFQENDFSFITPRFIANYTPIDDLLVYVSAARGVKSGGFNAGSTTAPTFDKESNWSYELGSKYTFADGAGTINAAFYFVDWEDQQVTAVDPINTRLPITINVAKTEITGAELDVFYSFSDWLRLNFGAAYIDAEYTEGFGTSIERFTDCAALPIPCDAIESGTPITSGNLAGQKVIGVPETTFNGGVQVNLPFFDTDWEFQGRLDYSWKDEVFLDEANSGFLDSRETVTLRLGIRDDNWSVDGYCNNLTNDDTPIFAAPPRDILGVQHYAILNRDERRCGLQLAYRN